MASSLSNSNLCPHNRFFFSDASLYLSVENTLYCVHKFLFEIHADMFPARDLDTSLSKPYVLGDVKKSDFDCLLASLYPRNLWVEEAETTQDWISILALASKWGFKSLRSRAVSKIEQTVDSPIDMVTLGRQYGIPNILLSGYAILCQRTVPLSPEEGHRLGMEDVLNIYRIRNQLYGSSITPVPLEAVFAKVKEAGLGAERPRRDDEHASTWIDVGSVTASPLSAEYEEASFTLTSNVNISPFEAANIDTATLGPARAERQQINVDLPSESPISVVTMGNTSNNIPSFMLPGNVLNPNPGPPDPDREGLQLLDELTTENFDLVSVEIMHWVNTKDLQTLHRITRLIVEKAIEAYDEDHPCFRLCKAMIKYSQTLQQITRLIVEKAIEEPRSFHACVYLCNKMVLDNHGYATEDGKVFREYLGEICQKNLESVAASAAVAGEYMARVRRLRFIRFIGEFRDVWTSEIIDKWVTALLDANDEEKVATLSMLMTRVGRWSCYRELHHWLEIWLENWLQRVMDVAQETSKPRVRTLLLDMKKLQERNWVAEPTEDCSLQ